MKFRIIAGVGAAIVAVSIVVLAAEGFATGALGANGFMRHVQPGALALMALIIITPVVGVVLPSLLVLAGRGRLSVWTALATGVLAGLLLTGLIAAIAVGVTYRAPDNIVISGARVLGLTLSAAMAGWGACRVLWPRTRPVDVAETF